MKSVRLDCAFVGMSDYVVSMVETASQIASGNLTIQVNPYSEKDELGIAFQQMVGNMNGTIKQISENSAKLN